MTTVSRRLFLTVAGAVVACVPHRHHHHPHPHPAPSPSPSPVVTPTPTPTPTPSAGPSGVAAPSATAQITTAGGTWKPVHVEDFTRDVPLGSFPGTDNYGGWWDAYDDSDDTSHVGRWSAPKTLSVSGSCLHINMHTEADGNHYAGVPCARAQAGVPYAGQVYGRYAVRARAVETGDTRHWGTAFLLWPNSQKWPADGEIDWPEGAFDGSSPQAFAHHADPNGGQDGFTSKNIDRTAWHTFVTEWGPGRVAFYVDDTLVGVSTTEVPTKAMRWALQCETSGGVPAAGSSVDVQVDWTALYSRA